MPNYKRLLCHDFNMLKINFIKQSIFDKYYWSVKYLYKICQNFLHMGNVVGSNL